MLDMALKAERRPSRRPKRPERHPHQSTHHRYSRFVGTMKVVLPALAVVLLGLVVVWPRLSFDDQGFHIGFANLSPEDVQTLSMVNARYFGVDQYNRPFTVTADVATEEDPKAGIVVLDEPKADFSTKSGANVYIEARKGYYHEKQELLELVGEVSMFHDSGYEIHTEEAEIDLEHSTAKGDMPVTGHGPQGKMDGEGFELHDSGNRIIVTGRSTLKLKGASGK